MKICTIKKMKGYWKGKLVSEKVTFPLIQLQGEIDSLENSFYFFFGLLVPSAVWESWERGVKGCAFYFGKLWTDF